MVKIFANSGDPDQTLHSAASDLSMHCLPVTLLLVSRLKWIKENQYAFKEGNSVIILKKWSTPQSTFFFLEYSPFQKGLNWCEG